MSKSAVLSVRVVADGKDAQRGLGDVSKSVGDLEGRAKSATGPMSKITSVISGIAKVAGGAVKTVGAVALGIAALAIKGGIAKSLQIENATAKMKGLKNSTQTVTAVMGDALKSVKGTAFGLGDAANIASTALASGIKPGQEMQKYLTLVADAASTAQVPLGEMGQIMGKVTNSGKVTNEVLQQFGDRGVGALQMLAKHYGVTTEEMTNMVSKGKVDAATFNQILTENIGGAAKKSGDTTMGALANMKSAMANFGIVLAGGFFPLFKGVFNQIQFIFEGLTERFKPLGDAFAVTFQAKAGPIIANFAKTFLGALDKIIGGFKAFAAAWQANDGDVTSSGFAGFMERVANAARSVQGVFKLLDFSSFDAFIASLGTAGGAAGNSLGSIGVSIQTLLPAFQAFIAQVPKLGGALVKLGGLSLNVLTVGLSFLADHVDTIIKFMPLIVTAFIAWKIASDAAAAATGRINALQVLAVPLTTANNVLRLIAIRQENQLAVATGSRTVAMQASLAAMVRQKVAMVASTAGMLAQKAAMGVAIAAQWAWNAAISANPIMLIVLGIAALVAGIILAYNNIGWFKDFVDGAFKLIGEIIANVFNWIEDNWGLLLSILIGPFGLLIQWLTQNWSLVSAVFKVVVDLIAGYVTNVVNFFKSAWSLAVLAVTLYIKAWQVVFATVVGVIRAVVTGIVLFFRTAWNSTINSVVGFIRTWQVMFAIVVGVIRGIISGVVGFFSSAWNGAVNAAVGFVLGFQNRVSSIFGTVKNKIQEVINFVRDGLSGAFQTAANLASGAMDSITAAIDGVIGWVKSAIDWVGSLFGATSNARSNASGLGGATGYMRGPNDAGGFGGGATGFMLKPAQFAPSGGSASPTVVNINLTVNGAVDGDGTAKTIMKLLREELRRTGVKLNGEGLW